MTPEQRRTYYLAHREEILAKQKAAYKAKVKKKKQAEYKRKWDAEHADRLREQRKAKWEARNTEEFRAERRRKYAEKHKDDPMTEHRKRCIEAQKERMTMNLEERKAKKIAKRAEEAAKTDIQKTYQQGEEESIRKRETVIKYIDKWTKRKIFATTTIKDGEFMSEADVRAYYREAVRYFEIEKRLRDTPPTDYTTRNILSYKMRVIEEHFNALLNKKYATKSKIINAI